MSKYVTYTSREKGPTIETWSSVLRLQDSGRVTDTYTGKKWQTSEILTESTTNSLSWTSIKNTAYRRIESFLNAVEKINSPYESTTKSYMPLMNYSKLVDAEGLYDGFVDVVLTFQTEVRLAGIEITNPWYGTDSDKWKDMPSRFLLFKVNDSSVNAELERRTYENSVMQTVSATGEKSMRPIRYDKNESDNNLIFLGKYDINWESNSSVKCFFRYNQDDQSSVAVELNNSMRNGNLEMQATRVENSENKEFNKQTINKNENSGIYPFN